MVAVVESEPRSRIQNSWSGPGRWTVESAGMAEISSAG